MRSLSSSIFAISLPNSLRDWPIQGKKQTNITLFYKKSIITFEKQLHVFNANYYFSFIHSVYTTRMLQPYLNSVYLKYAKVACMNIIFVQLYTHLNISPTLADISEHKRRVGLIYASVGLIYFLNG